MKRDQCVFKVLVVLLLKGLVSDALLLVLLLAALVMMQILE
jgi:hypothetical protein